MFKMLTLKVAQLVLFALLCYIGSRIINPAAFISLETSQRFAMWLDGKVNQENFDDLWVLVWVIGSLLFATVSYVATVWGIRKICR